VFQFAGKDVNLRDLEGTIANRNRQGVQMVRDAAKTERLRRLISRLVSLTEDGTLHWERQAGSAHRYARWNNNLLILGPDTPLSAGHLPRYLFITPFDSPAHIEINSNDEALGPAVLALVAAAEAVTGNDPPTDPFALTDEILSRLTG
jgi:hypothetical protein